MPALIRRLLVALLLALLLTFWPQIESGITSPLHEIPASGLLAQAPPLPTPAPQTIPPPSPPRVPPHLSPAPLTSASTVLAYPPPPIQARAAYLLDLDSGSVLFQKNADMRLPIASTTKITTAVLALQHARLSDLVAVSKRAATIGESTMALQQGERLTVRQLLYGMMLNSGNDAAIALAEHVAGTEERFVGMMNELARDLHMGNTHYVTAHGLDEPGHYSSARDLATVTAYAMRDPTFRKIVATGSYYVPASRHNRVHWLASVNRVMFWYPGVDGVKPGDTDAAGLCQVVSIQRDGRHLLAVLLNTPTLVTDIRNLLNFGLRDFRWVQAPAWWDGPANTLSGGSAHDRWRYYLGAGHYIRGRFLSYFDRHGGLATLGYPRTDEIRDGASIVQYFEGARLVYDPIHRTVYPEPLGSEEARIAVPRFLGTRHLQTGVIFRPFYKRLGGLGVFGRPVTGATRENRYTVQYFQYGEVAQMGGETYVVPVGDAALRLRGWLPSTGAADAYPATMILGPIDTLAPPHQRLKTHRRHGRTRRAARSRIHRQVTRVHHSRTSAG